MNAVRFVKNTLLHIERILGNSCAILMIACIFLQTVTRYVIGKPLTWTEELAIIFFIWSIYFGAIIAVSRGQHLKVGVLVENMRPRRRKIMQIVSDVVFGFVMIYLVFGISGIIRNLARFKALTAILRMPKYLIYSVLPACFILITLHLAIDVVECVDDLRRLNRGEDIGDGAMDPEIANALSDAEAAAAHSSGLPE